MEWSASILSYLKLHAKILAAVGIVAACVLFLPDAWVALIGLTSIRKQYAGWLGAAVLLGMAVVVVEGVSLLAEWLGHSASHRRDERERREQAKREQADREEAEAKDVAKRTRERKEAAEAGIRFLEGMTNPERAICFRFIGGRARTILLNAESGIVEELAKRGVIQPIGKSHYDLNMQAWASHFTMQDWAWDHLHAHRKLVQQQIYIPPVRIYPAPRAQRRQR